MTTRALSEPSGPAGDRNSEESSNPIWDRLVSCSSWHKFGPRDVLYGPDDSCGTIFWIRSGRVKESRSSNDGRELTFRHALAGDMLGEDCVEPRRRRETRAEAMVESEVGVIEVGDFLRLLEESASFAVWVLRRLALRTRELEHVLSETVFLPVRCRVASGVLRLHERQAASNGGTLRITHQEIANLVGSTRETTTSVLHVMRSEGIVEMANRRLKVLDPGRLAELAGRG